MKKVGLPVAGGITPQGQVIKELKHGRPDQNSQRVCSYCLFFSPPDFEMLFFSAVLHSIREAPVKPSKFQL